MSLFGQTTKWLAAASRIGLRLGLLLCSLPVLTGCGTLANGRGWGQDATLFPGWPRVGKAALHAALEPGTWAPAAGAAIFQIDHLDRQVSHWASNHTPIFGSQQNASGASDYLLGGSVGAYVITALATPSGDEPADWAAAKLKGLSVGAAAIGMTAGLTTGLKAAVNRPRPNGTGQSFPSGHASAASVCDTLASRNVDCLTLPDAGRLGLQIGFTALTVSTAWARVEARAHYPSDVLAGMALGHFIGAFINDAFLGTDSPFFLSVEPTRKDIYASIRWAF